MSMSSTEDELYHLLTPIIEMNEAIPEARHRWNIPDIIEWGERSGYLQWAKQQQQPISHERVRMWVKEVLPQQEGKLREAKIELRKAEKVLEDWHLLDSLFTIANQEMMPVQGLGDPSVLLWGKQSGYLKWARQQPKPLSRNHLQEWVIKNRQKAKLAVTYVNTSKSLLEIYQTRQHVWPQEENYKRIIHNVGKLGLAFMNAVGDLSSDRAKKYRFSTSAIDMLTYLMNPENIGDEAFNIPLPSIGIWIELTIPLLTPKGFAAALQFSPVHVLKDVEIIQKKLSLPARLYNHLLPHYQSFADDMPSHDSWVFYVIAPNGAIFEQWVYTPTRHQVKQGEWRKKAREECPTCIQASVGDIGYCPECCRCFDYYTSMLKTALLMLSGTFAEEEESIPYEVVSEQAISKIPREGNPKKSKVVMKTHHYTIVTFDACKKKVHDLSKEPQENHGSWVEATQAIDPDAIVYVEHHIAKTERTLRHERYIHKRGQTIPVRAHDKRIPMKVSELKRKITHVIASKYL